jgi:hypothetical protein
MSAISRNYLLKNVLGKKLVVKSTYLLTSYSQEFNNISLGALPIFVDIDLVNPDINGHHYPHQLQLLVVTIVSHVFVELQKFYVAFPIKKKN